MRDRFESAIRRLIFTRNVSESFDNRFRCGVCLTFFTTLSLLSIAAPVRAQEEGEQTREERIKTLEESLEASLENMERDSQTRFEEAMLEDDDRATLLDEEEAVVEFFAEAGQPAKKGEPLPFLKPVINSEISFIKRVCDPSEEQMTAIVAAATKAYEKTGDLVEAKNNRLFDNAQMKVMGPNNEQLSGNPFHRIRSDARKYLQPLVSKQQYATYQTEADQRDAFEQRAAIQIIVGIIDLKLVMTDEQRTKLTEVLITKWPDVDLQSIQNYVHNPGYVPQLPSDTIEKIVTQKQLKIWQSLEQLNFAFQFNFGGDGMTLEGEDWIK